MSEEATKMERAIKKENHQVKMESEQCESCGVEGAMPYAERDPIKEWVYFCSTPCWEVWEKKPKLQVAKCCCANCHKHIPDELGRDVHKTWKGGVLIAAFCSEECYDSYEPYQVEPEELHHDEVMAARQNNTEQTDRVEKLIAEANELISENIENLLEIRRKLNNGKA